MAYSSPARVIEHGLEESTQSALIQLGDRTILLDYLGLLDAELRVERALSKEHESYFDAQLCDGEQVGSVGVSSSTLVAALGITVHSTSLGQILLAQVQPNPFFA